MYPLEYTEEQILELIQFFNLTTELIKDEKLYTINTKLQDCVKNIDAFNKSEDGINEFPTHMRDYLKRLNQLVK